MHAILTVEAARRVLLALAMASAVGAAQGGAVEGDAPAASNPTADAAAQLLPPLGLPDVSSAAAAGIPPRPAPSQVVRGSARPTAVLHEAGAGLGDGPQAPGTHGETASAPRPADARVPARATDGRWDDSEIPAEVRSMGKAAVQWIKGVLPWSGDRDESPDTEVNWSNGPSRHSGSAAAVLLEGSGDAARASNDTANRGEEARPAGSQRNLLRDGIEAAREVLTHPMTWLVVALCIIGAIAFSLADRRPK